MDIAQFHLPFCYTLFECTRHFSLILNLLVRQSLSLEGLVTREQKQYMVLQTLSYPRYSEPRLLLLHQVISVLKSLEEEAEEEADKIVSIHALCHNSQQDDTDEVMALLYLENVDCIVSKKGELNESLAKATRRRFLSDFIFACIFHELDATKKIFS